MKWIFSVNGKLIMDHPGGSQVAHQGSAGRNHDRFMSFAAKVFGKIHGTSFDTPGSELGHDLKDVHNKSLSTTARRMVRRSFSRNALCGPLVERVWVFMI